ncbi:MAG: Tim44/TimA family putative adaptor protein [Pseudomonadota bacterium]
MNTHFDLILLAALAGFLIFRLFSILGKYNHPTDKPLAKDNADRAQNKMMQDIPTARKQVDRNTQTYTDNLRKLQQADSQFSEQSFLQGAYIAYESLFAALRDADQKTIKSLCSPKMQQVYQDMLATRHSRQWISKNELLRILSAYIRDIHLSGKTAKITVEFKAEQVLETRDVKNRLVEGDPDQIEIIEECWTFSRTMSSKNLNWRLVDVT